jgi:cyclic pyranopterin monophosphate synthase
VAPSAADGEVHGGASFTHLDGSGRARMVDVMGKPKTHRIAVARAAVVLTAELSDLIPQRQRLAEIMEAARYAGILAAKQTSKLIPLCHAILIDSVIVEIRPSSHRFEVEAVAQIVERTGVEMEALTACAMTALSLVGAFQDADPAVSVEEMTLWHKSGGRSGVWNRSDETAGATVEVSPATTSEATRSDGI